VNDAWSVLFPPRRFPRAGRYFFVLGNLMDNFQKDNKYSINILVAAIMEFVSVVSNLPGRTE
jgi:hypothetical protein